MRDRLGNLLAVLATGLADEQRRATAAATGLTDSGVAAVVALAQFLDGARIGDLAQVLGLRPAARRVRGSGWRAGSAGQVEDRKRSGGHRLAGRT